MMSTGSSVSARTRISSVEDAGRHDELVSSTGSRIGIVLTAMR